MGLDVCGAPNLPATILDVSALSSESADRKKVPLRPVVPSWSAIEMSRLLARAVLFGAILGFLACGPTGNVANNWKMGVLGPANEATIVAYSCDDNVPDSFEVALAGVVDGGNEVLLSADVLFVEAGRPKTFAHRFVGGDPADQIPTLDAYPENQHLAVEMVLDGYPQILDFTIMDIPSEDQVVVDAGWYGGNIVSMDDFVEFNSRACVEG